MIDHHILHLRALKLGITKGGQNRLDENRIQLSDILNEFLTLWPLTCITHEVSLSIP